MNINVYLEGRTLDELSACKDRKEQFITSYGLSYSREYLHRNNMGLPAYVSILSRDGCETIDELVKKEIFPFSYNINNNSYDFTYILENAKPMGFSDLVNYAIATTYSCPWEYDIVSYNDDPLELWNKYTLYTTKKEVYNNVR